MCTTDELEVVNVYKLKQQQSSSSSSSSSSSLSSELSHQLLYHSVLATFHNAPVYVPTLTWRHFTTHLSAFPLSPGHISQRTCLRSHSHLATFHNAPVYVPTLTWPHFTTHLSTFPLSPGHISQRTCLCSLPGFPLHHWKCKRRIWERFLPHLQNHVAITLRAGAISFYLLNTTVGLLQVNFS